MRPEQTDAHRDDGPSEDVPAVLEQLVDEGEDQSDEVQGFHQTTATVFGCVGSGVTTVTLVPDGSVGAATGVVLDRL